MEKKKQEIPPRPPNRPLEGYARGKTNWTEEQDDSAAAEVFANDGREEDEKEAEQPPA